MERLTIRNSDGSVKALPVSEWWHKNGLFYAKDIDPYDCRPYLERLAEYEDTGLGPEDMAAMKLLAASADPKKAQRLLELSEADADGRAEIFPCHIGETLYTVKDGRVYETPVIGYHSYEWQQGFRMRLLFDTRRTNGCFDYPISDYGKAVFPTREEAEAALKEARS